MPSARDNVSEIIASLMKADRTAPEVAAMTGCHVRTVSGWLRAFRQSGLVREVKTDGVSARWAWQRTPFELEDSAQ
jgi:transposase